MSNNQKSAIVSAVKNDTVENRTAVIPPKSVDLKSVFHEPLFIKVFGNKKPLPINEKLCQSDSD